MKNLLTLAMIAMIAISCNNDNLINESNDSSLYKKESYSRNSIPTEGFYYNSNYEAYYNGEKIFEIYGEDAELIKSHLENEEFSRSIKTQCRVKSIDGSTIVLSQVYGDGRPSNYFISIVGSDGSVHTFENPGLTCNDIRNIEG